MIVIACDVCKKTNLEVAVGFYTREYAFRADPTDRTKTSRELIGLHLLKERPSNPNKTENVEFTDICAECSGKTSQMLLEPVKNKTLEQKPTG